MESDSTKDLFTSSDEEIISDDERQQEEQQPATPRTINLLIFEPRVLEALSALYSEEGATNSGSGEEDEPHALSVDMEMDLESPSKEEAQTTLLGREQPPHGVASDEDETSPASDSDFESSVHSLALPPSRGRETHQQRVASEYLEIGCKFVQELFKPANDVESDMASDLDAMSDSEAATNDATQQFDRRGRRAAAGLGASEPEDADNDDNDNDTAVTLETCLSLFERPDQLSSYDCPNCKRMVARAQKAMRLTHLPKSLIIHLKRFDYTSGTPHGYSRYLSSYSSYLSTSLFGGYFNSNSGRGSKITTNVEFGDEFMGLKLRGIVQHFGWLEGGHYTAFVKPGGAGEGSTAGDSSPSSPSSSWFLCDDSLTSRVSKKQQVMQAQEACYVLFYSLEE